MSADYHSDIIAWADKQAALLRAGRLDELDIEHLAEEIEDVGKSERRELARRMPLLLAHLLEWQFQPGRRGSSWQRTIKEQRRAIAGRLVETLNLQTSLSDLAWIDGVWADAVAKAADETGLTDFPDHCPWPMDEVLAKEFFPG